MWRESPERRDTRRRLWASAPQAACNWGRPCLFYGTVSSELDVDTKIDETTETKEPDEYRVILLNDDFTTMEFVVAVLMSVFHKGILEATRIMYDVHRKGRGVVGIYAYDIAATKVKRVHEMARENGFPLKCTMEKA